MNLQSITFDFPDFKQKYDIPQTAEDVGAAPAIEDATYAGCYYRMVGGEKEWINPPMVLGEEYRTTKRHNGNVVYTKAVNIDLGGSGYKRANVATGISEVVSMVGTYYENWGGVIAESKVNVSSIMIDISSGNLQINSADLSGTTAKYTVEYTK